MFSTAHHSASSFCHGNDPLICGGLLSSRFGLIPMGDKTFASSQLGGGLIAGSVRVPQSNSLKKILATAPMWKKRPKMSDKKDHAFHLRPKQLMIAAIKHFIIVSSTEVLPQILEYQQRLQKEIEQMEDDDDEIDLDLEIDWGRIYNRQFPGKVVFSFLRFLALESKLRWAEAKALVLWGAKTADRLVRDPAKSSAVKAAKYGRLVAATKMLKTAFYSQCLFYSASLCFDSLVFLVQYGIAKVRKQEAEIKDVGRKIVAKSYSFVISLGGVVIGAAVGTAIKPGRGCFWGMVAGDLAAQLLIPVSMLH
ncbi:unnamed protein product [Heterosigma akashiwo]|uniref:Uncharacterized protein n=1 Tax=Heterosigma akashiwo TaxID=2829 RepID=A0A6V1QJ64_HETAK|mmetsp:Transcript_21691/g.34774  ORF Transcript_21691/g.34774 Transcript_21691/m.34774 type:complete len:308 (+) Transcript_21691:76-999(+)